MPTLRSLLFGCALILSVGVLPAQAQPTAPIRYEITFPNRAHHEAEITIRFAAVPTGPLRVEMARGGMPYMNSRRTSIESRPLTRRAER
jgi:hypothetical protein